VRRITIAAVLAGALLLAGCGSTDTGVGEENGEGTRTASEQEARIAYDSGYLQCEGFTLKDLQQTYSAAELTKESVGEAVARSNPGQPELREPTKQGCIDAIDKKPRSQSGRFAPQDDTNTTE
jgi:hypothetical protein